jgi:GntR family transcriptional regulator
MFSPDLGSRKPIYEQLVDKFKEMIIHDVLKINEQIPSVRQLAKVTSINPNTIQKAYRELERQGYICTISGRGNFVCEKIRKVDQEKVDHLKREIQKCVSELLFMGLDKEELLQLIEKTYETTKGEKDDD